MFYYIFWFIAFVFIIAIFILFKYWTKKKKLSSEIIKDYNKKFLYIKINISPKERIIDFDKFYHLFLKELSYEWNFSDILKQNPSEIKDINKIWELHKLRNKLVHDFDEQANSFLLKKANEYETEVKKLLNQF